MTAEEMSRAMAAFAKMGETLTETIKRTAQAFSRCGWTMRGGTVVDLVVTDDRGQTRTVRRYVGGWQAQR